MVLNLWFLKKNSFSPEFMTRCQNHGGWYQWGAVLMEVATTTTHIQLCGVVIVLSLLTSTCLDVPRQQKLFYMVCCSCRRKSIDARMSHFGGRNRIPTFKDMDPSPFMSLCCSVVSSSITVSQILGFTIYCKISCSLSLDVPSPRMKLKNTFDCNLVT